MYLQAGDRPIVQKYGGTSVGTVERISSIAARIAAQVAAGNHRIAVVVSAMSGETNHLVDLVRQINPAADDRNYDLAVSAGEQVSVALMAAALEKEGIAARGFLGYQLGILTDSSHARARIRSIDCQKLHDSWDQGCLPVIAGFQGVTTDLEITTLGRGGSDTSAVALAVALGAAFCEINTDVNGVYTADPRMVKSAKLARTMDFEVALEMASLGSKVLHSRCVELGAKYEMPILVRSTFNQDESIRTEIMDYTEGQRLEAPVVSGITVDQNVARITVDGLPANPGIIPEIFNLIGEQGINVDIIVHNQPAKEKFMNLGFTINREDVQRTLTALDDWKKSWPDHPVVAGVEDDLVKVSVVGLGMRSHSGVASKTFTILARAGIDLHMISTSEIKISCVLAAADGSRAANALHEAFIENGE